MHRRSVLQQMGAVAMVGIAGCTGVFGETEYDIGMSAMEFLPADFTVETGSTVTWKNDGSRAHTVTAYDDGIPDAEAYFASGGFDSESEARDAWHANKAGNFYSGERYQHTFTQPGEYYYFCIPHERGGMTGRIVVD